MPTYRQNELRWFGKLPVLVVATVFTYGQLTICIIATPAKRTSKQLGRGQGAPAAAGRGSRQETESLRSNSLSQIK